MSITFGPDTGPCAVCEKPSSRPCSRCRVDFYCGKEHQVFDWQRHRKGCGVLAVRHDELLGRHLVAVRDIPVGTVLMKEVPLVAVPKPPLHHDSCVGCFAVLPASHGLGCRRCGWPVCGDPCSLKDAHALECSAFQRANFKLSSGHQTGFLDRANRWGALGALRVCLASKQTPQGPLIRQLQSDIREHFKDAGAYAKVLQVALAASQVTVNCAVSWLRDVAGITWIAAEDIRQALIASCINGLSASSFCPVDPFERKVGGLFAGISLLEHSCVANTFAHAWQRADAGDRDRLVHVLVASKPISRGEHLSLSYLDDDIRGTSARRLKLQMWGFLCRCALCSDPTEFGLHLEAWHCGHCQVAGRRCLVRLPDLGRWSCDVCGKSGSLKDDPEGSGRAAAARLQARMQTLLDRNGQVFSAEWEALIAEALGPKGPLHPTHFIVLEAKKQLVFGRVLDAVTTGVGAAGSDRAEVFRRTLAYSRDLLHVIDVLRGYNTSRRDVLTRQMVLMDGIMTLPGPRDKLLGAEFLALCLKMKDYAIDPFEKSMFKMI